MSMFTQRRCYIRNSVNTLKPPLLNATRPNIYQRNITSWYRKVKSLTIKSDRVSPTDELVFLNHNRNYFLPTYFLLSVATVPLIGVTIHSFWNYFLTGVAPSGIDIDFPMTFLAWSNVFAISLLSITYMLMSRMFMRIYYNPVSQKFTGVRYTWKMTKERIEFGCGSVRQLDVPPGLRELRGNYMINNKPFYLNVSDFTSPLYYNIMMGFIKPK